MWSSRQQCLQPSFTSRCCGEFSCCNAIILKIIFLWALLPLGIYYTVNLQLTPSNSDFSQQPPVGCWWWRPNIPEGIRADVTSLEETGAKGVHSFSSSICQNSENLLGEKLMLLDTTGSVALLTVLNNSKKKRLHHQISIKRRKTPEVWTEQQMLWHVKASMKSLMERVSVTGSSQKPGCLWHLGCERGRYMSPQHPFPTFPALEVGGRPRFHGWTDLSRMERYRTIHNTFGKWHLRVNGFPIAAIPHLPAKNMTAPEKCRERTGTVLEPGRA